MIKEKTSVRILINGNLEKTAKAQIINGKELEIKTKTIGGKIRARADGVKFF